MVQNFVTKIVNVFALLYKNFSISRESSRELLKTKRSNSFLTPIVLAKEEYFRGTCKLQTLQKTKGLYVALFSRAMSNIWQKLILLLVLRAVL